MGADDGPRCKFSKVLDLDPLVFGPDLPVPAVKAAHGHFAHGW